MCYLKVIKFDQVYSDHRVTDTTENITFPQTIMLILTESYTVHLTKMQDQTKTFQTKPLSNKIVFLTFLLKN